nr:NADH-quinone oxidoreductase subunit H [Spirochaetota bacterium]
MMEIIINIALLFILPFLFLGLINRVKSIWAGRRGPSIIQPFRDFMRLMKKGEVISTTASFVFRIAPSVNFAAVIAAGLIVPMAGGKSIISFEADFILFAYLLAAGKFLTVAGAMDTGSAFEGMGASREVTFSALVEPAFFVIIASLSLISGGLSFDKIFSVAHNASVAYLVLPLGVIALFIMLLTEGCRVPVDDPNTHLELTMIHEVMVLDNSGPDMGFIVYAAAMKMVVIGSIIANLIIP